MLLDGSRASPRDAAQHLSYRTLSITTSIRPTRSKGGFATFGLSKNLLRAVSEIGFLEPRPIQAKTIPQVLLGRDVLGLAQTGTGKTAAFALPIIERLVAGRGRNPRALILAPTRELAIQIHAEIEQLAKYSNVRAITVFGGVGAAPQVRALRSRPDIVVACPGRLLDLMGSRDASMEGIEVLVLDEADHMLDMGFLPDIKRILARLPEPRQNLLFSATMPREIRTFTDRVLKNPHVVELALTTPLETIEHVLYPIEQARKAALLMHLLGAEDFKSAIVFLRTKHRAKRLARDLDRAGHRAIALQGNMSQGQRQRAMQGFRDGNYDVLVATDIAARGIDVAQVSHVINFDIPNTPDAYTHRIGRTGRAERSGKAYTFVTHDDFPAVKDIERKLGMEIPRIKTQGTLNLAKEVPEPRGFGRQPANGSNGRPGGGRGGARTGGGRGRSAVSANGRSTRAASTRPAVQGSSAVTVRATPERDRAPGEAFGAGLAGASPAAKNGAGARSKNGRKRLRMRTQGSAQGAEPGRGPGARAGSRGAGRR